MDTKTLVLDILRQNCGSAVSGTQIAAQLNLSRNAVCKAVAGLKKDGWEISAATNRGYILQEGDMLCSQEIVRLAGEDNIADICMFSTVESTNSEAVRLAVEGAAEGTVVIADSQTVGRGRKGRNFFSPKGTGIYMSLVLRPKFSAERALFITTAAAVAAARAIEKETGREALVKWVNDVYCDGKKVCGILTEAAMDVESGGLAYAVLGAGFNVYRPATGFPEELKNIAGSICGTKRQNNLRNRIAAGFVKEFFALYKAKDTAAFMQEYRRRSIVLGETVTVYCGNEVYDARAVDIDKNAALIVELPDGERKSLTGGEITIRKKETVNEAQNG